MPALAKASLQEISGGPDAKPVPDTEIPVQFNPQSLKLSLANKVESSSSRAQQVRQYMGKTSTVLTFDLHFDTADEGTTDAPVSVRTRTAAVERFVLPKGAKPNKQRPPKARFSWGSFVIDGIIEDVAIDFELFASDGTPLRAKTTITMKEQDAKYQMGQIGPAANRGGSAPAPGGGGAGPGSRGGGPTDTTRAALAGESAADFAARVGLDPAAWRGVAAQMGSTLSLTAGAEIDFSSELSIGGGIGMTAGIGADIGASIEASLGLEAGLQLGISASAGVAASGSAGFALSAAGGVSAAIETANVVRTEHAATAARQAFASAVPARPTPPTAGANPARGIASSPAAIPSDPLAPTTSPNPGPPDQPRAPLAVTAALRASPPSSSPPAPPPPLADPRAVAFGFGVPLRPRVGSAADVRTGALAGRIPLRPRARPGDAIVPADPSAAPWTTLPPDRVRPKADAAHDARRPGRCGCGGSCADPGSASRCGCGGGRDGIISGRIR